MGVGVCGMWYAVRLPRWDSWVPTLVVDMNSKNLEPINMDPSPSGSVCGSSNSTSPLASPKL